MVIHGEGEKGRMMEIHPLTGDRLDDLARLFETHTATRGCHCRCFLVTNREYQRDWGAENRARFEEFAKHADPPAGLVAYHDDEPVGWCAVGPRSRYTRALRSNIMSQRDPGEDDDVWLVPCFFVRVGYRGRGIIYTLLASALDLAQSHGAKAIEGFPLVGGKRHRADGYYGRESVFATCGFTPVAQPSPGRRVMRRDFHQ